MDRTAMTRAVRTSAAVVDLPLRAKVIRAGYGPHFCVGAFLGRAHVSAMLGGLREPVSDIEPRGEPQRLFSNFVCGYQSVPLALHG